MELPYVFGDWDHEGFIWPAVFHLTKPSGATSADPGCTDTDRQVSEVMMKLWTNFAKTGDPSVEGFVNWPAWNEAKDQYLYITEKPSQPRLI